jgi:splicing factor 45
MDIALIQEPWVYKGQVRGLNISGGTIYAVAPGKNSRSCIYIRNHINALPLLEFCSRAATTVRIIYMYEGGNRELVVTSAYLTHDSDEPPHSKEVKDIIDYCYSRKKQLIIGCDANAHHILWGALASIPEEKALLNIW